jgi:hypothetical protein
VRVCLFLFVCVFGFWFLAVCLRFAVTGNEETNDNERVSVFVILVAGRAWS